MTDVLYKNLLELKKSEQVFNDLIHATCNPVVVLDKEYKIINMNEPAILYLCKNKGYSKNMSWLTFCKDNNIVVDINVGMDVLLSSISTGTEYFATTIHSVTTLEDIVIRWRIVSFFSSYILLGKNLSASGMLEENNVADYGTKLPSLLAHSITNLSRTIKAKEILQGFLIQIMNAIRFQGNLKNENLEYIFFSDKSRKILGISSLDNIRGKTVKALHLSSEYTEQVQEIDNQLVTTKRPRIGVLGKPFLDSSGEIRQLRLNKIPLLDENGEIVFLLTIGMDASTIKNPIHIRRLYRLIYKSSAIAHCEFIKHYGLDKYKNDQDAPLTEREMDVILSLTKNNSAKKVAADLNISEGTVRKHIDSIKYKMNCYSKNTIVDNFLNLVEKTNKNISL